MRGVVAGSRSPHRYRLLYGVAMRRRLKTIELECEWLPAGSCVVLVGRAISWRGRGGAGSVHVHTLRA